MSGTFPDIELVNFLTFGQVLAFSHRVLFAPGPTLSINEQCLRSGSPYCQRV